MAAQSGEDENYWPGYVDALTTMTMVLTFILMVLGITIFSLSQNVSRSYLESIARAAGMSVQSGAGSLDELKQRIMGALEAERAAQNGAAKTDPATAAAPSSKPDPASAAGRSPTPDPVTATLPAPPPVSFEAMTADLDQAARSANPRGPAIELPPAVDLDAVPDAVRQAAKATGSHVARGVAQVATSDRPTPAVTDEGVGQGSGAPGSKGEVMAAVEPNEQPVNPARTVETKLAADPPAVAGGRYRASDAALTIIYKPRVVRLDDAAQAEVKRFAESAESRRAGASFVVKGYASMAGSLTENRRAAYYRAMMVRGALIAAGLAGSAITIRVEDTGDMPRAESVTISRG
jgi:outer membrane protein OmpA-like peptidoglycan-associated protein